MVDHSLSQEEISLINEALRLRIEVMQAKMRSLGEEIVKAEATLAKINQGVDKPSKGGSGSPLDDTFNNLVEVFRSEKRKWLKSGRIREAYEEFTGEEISRNKLRRCLHRGNGTKSFEMRGDRRFAEWKLIDEGETK